MFLKEVMQELKQVNILGLNCPFSKIDVKKFNLNLVFFLDLNLKLL